MGTILFPGGAGFRVWAPNASGIAVSGEFNNWSETANPLRSEGNGLWYGEVKGAHFGQQYEFVIFKDGKPFARRKNPYASAVVNSVGKSIIHDPTFDWSDDSFTMSPWNELVIYEMHVGSFYKRGKETDSPATFDGVTAKMPYLRDLGINAIQIMPVSEYAMDYSWGYNPSQPFAVESALGGPQGLYRFIKSAHRHGIAVILDVVYNHFGPGDLDLWQFDGWSDENHEGGIYFYDNERAQTPWGGTRPDYGRAEVRQYLRDNAQFWLNKYRVDGLRFDSVVNIRNWRGSGFDPSSDLADGWRLLQEINDDVRNKEPWKITIAEDLQGNDWVTKDTGAGGAGFGSQWDASFVHTIRNAIITGADEARDMYAVAGVLANIYNGDLTRRVIYTESHDEVANGRMRVPEEIWQGSADSWFSRKRSTLGAALVFTAPGIPMIFQGQEFLESGYFQDTNPLDWSKLKTFAGINQLYRDLIHLRRNWNNQTRGLSGQHINVHHINDVDKIIAFHRWENHGAGDDVIVVANFANRSYDNYTIGLPAGGMWRVRFNSDWQGYSDDFGNQLGYDTAAEENAYDGMSHRANVGIGAYSVLILSQD
ncbi:MAG: alpha amylase C-terminal domain-containing protein [Anaerolineae bacterium]|nr:alpha amylase C-terminal domain-containing protein [Anaerolineae bacterium]